MKKLICASAIAVAAITFSGCNMTPTNPGVIPFKEPTKVVTCKDETFEAIKVRRATPFIQVTANEGKMFIRLDRDCTVEDYVAPEVKADTVA